MTHTHDRNARFPVDWSEWRPLWDAWITEQLETGQLTRSSYRFPPANFLADEVLGVYGVRGPNGTGRAVELSEVTFPDLSESASKRGRPSMARYVGVTFGSGSGTESGGIASTFGELERALGL